MPAMSTEGRMGQIARARQIVIAESGRMLESGLEPQRGWIERSWRRCLDAGHRPEERLEFDPVSAAKVRACEERHRGLLIAARPVLDGLAHAVARTGYFAMLTDAQGIVIHVSGGIDRSDRRAHCIARVGVNLSEARVGTSAISAALIEGHPVWLHRDEHFFVDAFSYSCAGAPIMGPGGDCLGMIDLTGVDVVERTELMHLVARAARCVENALVLQRPHALALRMNWPGQDAWAQADGLICLDADGWVVGANPVARAMIPALASGAPAVHVSEVFAISAECLFQRTSVRGIFNMGPLEVPLWTGLRVQLLPVRLPGTVDAPAAACPSRAPQSLRQVQDMLVRSAVDAARGNVAQAARALGVSRATVYRKLRPGSRR